MKTSIVKFLVSIFLMGIGGQTIGQVLGSGTLPISGAVVFNGVKLEDDGAVTVGALNGQVHLVRWSNDGDTLWTRTHPLPITAFGCGPLIRFANGDLLVAGRHLFDESGSYIETNDFGGNNVEVVGEDSLLVIRADSMRLVRKDHTVLWQRPFACQVPGSEGWYWAHQHCVRSSDRLTCSSAYRTYVPSIGPISDVYISRYQLDGALIDTTRLISSSTAPPVGICRGFDGGQQGALLAAHMGVSCCPVFMRTGNDGILDWFQQYSLFDWPVDQTNGHAPHQVLIREDGSLLSFGITTIQEGTDYSAQIGLMEFSAGGSPLCWQPLGSTDLVFGNWDILSPLGFAYINSDGSLIAIGTTIGGELEPVVVWSSFGSFCISTRVDRLPQTSHEFGCKVVQGNIEVTKSDGEGPYTIRVFDVSGALVIEDVSNSSLHHVSTSALLPGLYLMEVTDLKGKGRAVFRFVLGC